MPPDVPCPLSRAWLAGEQQVGCPKPSGIQLVDLYVLPLASSCLPEELRLCHEAVREFLSMGDPVANPSADAVFHKHVKDTESRFRRSDLVRSCTYFLVRADLFEEALEEPMLRVALFKLVLCIVYIGKGYHTRVESHLKQAFREAQSRLRKPERIRLIRSLNRFLLIVLQCGDCGWRSPLRSELLKT